MSFRTLLNELLVVTVFILVWSLFCWIISKPADLESNLISGLSNCVFLCAGLVAFHLFRSQPSEEVLPLGAPDGQRALTLPSLVARVSLAVVLGLLLINFLAAGMDQGIDTIVQSHEARFNVDGRRDIQAYTGGILLWPVALMLAGYMYHIGSKFGSIPFKGIFAGVLIPIGFLSGLSILSSSFQPLQVSSFVGVQIPAIFNQFGPAMKEGTLIALSFALALMVAGGIALLMWIAAIAGAFRSRGWVRYGEH
jgi:hypothetical protein